MRVITESAGKNANIFHSDIYKLILVIKFAMQEMLLYWICFHIQHLPFFGVQVLKSAQYNKKTKLCIYQSCVSSTLPYSSECWWITEAKLKRLLVFHRTCLWRISCIFWPRTISNQELMEQCQLEDTKNRRWRWIWHVLWREPDSIARVAIHWTSEGKRKRGRP